MRLNSLVVILAVFFSMNAYAFEKQSLNFSLGQGKKPDVSFSFTGFIAEQPLELLDKKRLLKEAELKNLQVFFQKLYEANKNGTKDDILKLWNVEERKDLEKGIDAKSEEANKARFQALTNMRLKMVVEYSEFYICYLEMVFEGEKTFVMKFPLIKTNKELFLTNKLNGDYFYDNISHLLDKNHFQMATQ
jgi:hypothetical protein